jgi:signal transduction histidine kinase
LGAILGRAQLIRLGLRNKRGESGDRKDELLQKELEIIEQAATNGASTIKKIQEFSRSKTEDSLFVLLNVNEVMQGAVELIKTKIKDEAEEKGIPIQVRMIQGEVCYVMGNPAELKEVLFNILLNSIDAMHQGGTISLQTKRENGTVSIEVSDEGRGSSSAVRHRIFDPFFTTKGIQRSGLGLSISYAIIQRHLGEIQVESQEGIGSTFMIKLPIAKVGELLKEERE